MRCFSFVGFSSLCVIASQRSADTAIWAMSSGKCALPFDKTTPLPPFSPLFALRLLGQLLEAC